MPIEDTDISVKEEDNNSSTGTPNKPARGRPKQNIRSNTTQPKYTNNTELSNAITDDQYNDGVIASNLGLDKKVAKKNWLPASMLTVTGKKPGYRYRFINSDKPGNLRRKLAEGWEICQDESIHSPNNNNPGTVVKVRELLLARMPEEKAIARNKYYMDRQKTHEDIKNEYESKINKIPGAGNMAYGKIEYTS